MRVSSLLLSAALIAGSVTQGFAEMTKDEIRQGFKEHAALAQYYRWYQYYERPKGGIANAIDILAEDVIVVSGLGTAKGHAEYEARVTQLPTNWQNAHHVKSTAITHNDDGTMRLFAEITYQNKGLLEDGTELLARTKHEWTVENDVTERFARIKRVDVEVLEPFRPKGG